MVVWLGDIFDHPRPTYRSYRVAQQGLARIREHGVPAVIITGNHDTPRLPGTGSPYTTLFDAFPEFHFAHRLSYERFELPGLGVTFHAVPQMLTVESTLDALAQADQSRSLDASNVLLTHPRITQVQPRYADINEIEVDAGLLQSDFVLLGHYHFHTKVREGTWYAGSTDTFTFSDDPDKEKGVVLLDTTSGALTHHPLAGQRALVTLETIHALGLSPSEVNELVLARAAGVPAGAVARLFIEGIDAGTYRLLDADAIRAAAAQAFHLKLEPQFVGVDMKVDLPDMDSMPARWERYVDDQDLTGFDRHRVRDLGNEYLSPRRRDRRLAVRITRLYLRNYRVYEDELDLAMPGGLVGIFGPNGAGKSALLESILWTLWGRSRTRNDEIRTTGIGAECITEVEFEHESHLYTVRRTISGINTTVKAEAFADHQQVANGMGDVKRYIHSVLGMDDVSFRASVFAEQKQIAAFSSRRPAERRDLVLKLLGITPLDTARDAARSDARQAKQDVERLRAYLPDLDELRRQADEARAKADMAKADAESEAVAAATAARQHDEAEQAVAALDEVRVEHERLVAEGRSARDEMQAAEARIDELTDELTKLAEAADQAAALRPAVAELDELERLLALVTAATQAASALARVPAELEPSTTPDDAALTQATVAAEEARQLLDTATGEMRAAAADVERARQHLDRSAELSEAGDCPVCGQALGGAFAAVQAHRRQELADAEARAAAASAERDRLRSASTAAAEHLTSVAADHASAVDARRNYEAVAVRRRSLEAALAEAEGALGRAARPDEHDEVSGRVKQARDAARTLDRLTGRLDRLPQAETELATARERHGQAAGRRATLLDKVRALGFDDALLAQRRAARDEAKARAKRATDVFNQAHAAALTAVGAADGAAGKLEQAEAQHAKLAESTEAARHIGRVAELLGAFRTNVVATVGPRLSAQAAELFDELTDHEYDLLQVDPETYEIQIIDQGRTFGMDRFSGSETDLANLALRVAISEHVRFQSGGAVGLLVLDEVFGPLDTDRKERMLLALERLRDRFGQVLVVTHDNEIKEQMPGAIEVIKLPGRRATARVVTGV